MSEHRLFGQQCGEAFDQRSKPRLRHGRDQLVEHASLPKQRMCPSLGGVGLKHPVVSQRLAGRAEQRKQRDGERIQQEQSISPLRRADADDTHAHAIAQILGIAEPALDIPQSLP